MYARYNGFILSKMSYLMTYLPRGQSTAAQYPYYSNIHDAGSIRLAAVSKLLPRLHYQPVSSRFSSCALTSPVSTSVCVYITTARTGLNQRQLVRLFHSTVAGSRAVPKHVRACR